MDKKCCENCDKCACSHGEHAMMMLECCQEHKMSKEHLEAKKKMLEEKLKWVNEKLEGKGEGKTEEKVEEEVAEK